MKKKAKSTFEEFIENNPEQKISLDQEYNDLLVSELLLASMEDDQVSVRKLAKAAGVSPTIIQALRSSKKTNITLNTLSRVLDAIGYELILLPKDRPIKRLKLT